jgi:predicted peptidase
VKRIRRQPLSNLAAAAAVLLCLFAAGAAGGQTSASEALAAASPRARLVRQPYTSSSGEERQYLIYLPAGFDTQPERRWPVLLFLHGDGERGNGLDELDWVMAHGPLYEAWVQRRDLPFIILAPQLPLFGRDKLMPYLRDRDPAAIPRRLEEGKPPRPDEFPTPQPMEGAAADSELPMGPEGPPDGWPSREQDLLAMLDQALAVYRGDPDRIYLTGLSYGGFGTWYLASRHPERFAAIAPVVGWGHPALMAPLAEHQVPVWAFAGGRDPVVPVRYFYAGLNELERLGDREVLFTVHEDTGHDTWQRVYAGLDLYGWLLSHRREAAERSQASSTR